MRTYFFGHYMKYPSYKHKEMVSYFLLRQGQTGLEAEQ